MKMSCHRLALLPTAKKEPMNTTNPDVPLPAGAVFGDVVSKLLGGGPFGR
jgi:hypothetical protein